jgi:hypothetical protein
MCQDCYEPNACHLAGRDFLQLCCCNGQVVHCRKWPATGRRDRVVDDLRAVTVVVSVAPRIIARTRGRQLGALHSPMHCARPAPLAPGLAHKIGELNSRCVKPKRNQALQLGAGRHASTGSRDGGGRVGV